MDVESAVQAGKGKHQGGAERKSQRRLLRDLSASNLIGVYTQTFEELGYGKHPMILSKTLNMAHGFVRACRINDIEAERVYATVKTVIAHWPEIRRKEHWKNGKEVLLGNRPFIHDFLMFRESITSALVELASELERTLPEKQEVNLVQPVKKAPTQEDLDAEYSRLQDEE